VRRYVILVASVVMQMCLGATYSWSVFVQPLKDSTGLSQGPVQLPFTLFYFAFPATMIFAGQVLPRLGPRICAAGGGILFGCGWLLAGWGGHWFVFTVLGIGLLAGIGVGMAYIVPLATCIRWFPEHKGLVTGIAVAGFGGGAALVSQTGAWLMTAQAVTPFEAFRILGAAFVILVVGAGVCMQYPPGTRLEQGRPVSLRQVIPDRGFRILYLAMGSGLAAGFAVNANLKELFVSDHLTAGVSAVGLFALANAAGRITWGWLFDRLKGRAVVIGNLLCQAMVLMLSPWILISDKGLLMFALLTGFNFGGVLVVYASSVAHMWGSAAVSQIYGVMFSANIPAALAPVAAGVLFDMTGSFIPALYMIALLIVAAAIVFWKNERVVTRNGDTK
jgi:MFS transporter, OFA family, oxalate/formate antiporter